MVQTDFRILGPLEVLYEDQPVILGGSKQRALLAFLLLHVNETLSTDRLIDELWGESPPATAVKTVQVHVSRLRKTLGGGNGNGAPGILVTRGHGYELQLAPERLDANRFEELASEGRDELTAGRHERAVDVLERALSLWRGTAFADLSDEPFVQPAADRLDDLRIAAAEQLIEAKLALGGHGEVIGRLETLIAEHPYRERLRALLMIALYRSDRQADALQAYHSARRRLVEDLGLEPGERLRDLERSILAQDPALIHRAARESARAEASRRLGVAADRAASERRELRVAEADLAGTVAELQGVDARGDPAPDEDGAVVACPFKGLASFDIEDAAFFFGRERLVADMVGRLAGAPLMGIVGPSGSGKSSALRAGLLAALGAGVLPGSDDWPLALLRPGEHPVGALERATAEAAPRGRWIIAVDQFEETFTACRDESERSDFVDALLTSARHPRRRALVLVAMRADFYGRCAAYPELARLVGANHVLVGPMRRDELRRAIELPARRAGMRIDPGLVDALVDDVAGEPGALPLLSTALLELWRHRDGRRLRLSAYEQAGGVRGAVARMADDAYERLDRDRQEVARRILLRLAGEGDGDTAVRRRVPIADLGGDRDARIPLVLSALARDRLVTVGAGEVEVAHEALLREWPRLRSWLEDDAEGRRLHRHLIHAASDWQAAGRDPAELYRGARLTSALDWAAGRDDDLNDLEREFLDESRALAERESERQRRTNRRLRALLGGVAALLAVAVVAGVVALIQRGNARDASVTADAERLSAEALNQDQLDAALVQARAAVDLHESHTTESNLLSVLLRAPAALGVLPTDGWGMYAIAASPDGRLVAAGTQRGTVTVWDATTRRVITKYQLGGGVVQTLRFSRDGSRLAVSGQEPANEPPGALVDVIDPRTAKRLHRYVLPPFPEPVDFVYAHAAFLPNGRDLVAEQTPSTFPDSGGSVFLHLDGRTGAIGPRLRVGQHSGRDLLTTADGRRVFVTSPRDDATYEIDAEHLRVLRRYPIGDHTGAISADGNTLALGSDHGIVRVVDLRSGRVRSFAGRHTGQVNKMVFAPDGRTLVSAGQDGKVIAWDVASGAIRETFSAHTDEVSDLDVTTDGRTAYTAGQDGRAMIWDLTGDRRLVRPFAVADRFVTHDGDEYPRGIVVSPDGRTVALTGSDGRVELRDAETMRPLRGFQAMAGFAPGIDWSRDGRLIVVTGEGGRVMLWDAHTLRPAGELKGMQTTSQAIAFSPDGRLVAASEFGDDKHAPALHVWDVRQRRLVWTQRGVGAGSVSFSPDSRLIAAAAIEFDTSVYDARTGRRIAKLRDDDEARSVRFSPDGRTIAIGHYDGIAQLWSTANWRPFGRPLKRHEGRVISLSFSPDGKLLTTSGIDGTVVLWDVATQKPIGSPVAVEPNPNTYIAATLTPDGARLIAVSNRHRGVSMSVSPAVWKRDACLVAGRELSRAEWNDAVPGHAFRPVCAPVR